MTNSAGNLSTRYELRGLLGRGGVGEVHRAYDCILQREVAVKGVYVGASPQRWHRTLREGCYSAALSHKHIVTTYDVLSMESWFVIVMQLLLGGTLQKRMLNGIGLAEAVNYLRCLLSALAYAHKLGIVHRDLKPSNIMFTADSVLKLVDFGLARSEEDFTVTKESDIVGTIHYMAPEQIRGERVGRSADLYAVGVIAYEMVTGVKPFDDPSLVTLIYKVTNERARLPSELKGELPPEMNSLILKALAKNPADRYETADEFLDALCRADFRLGRGYGIPTTIPRRRVL